MAQWCPNAANPAAGALYDAMLRSVRATGQPVAGVLWHQGEGDTASDRAALYTERLDRLIAATRRDLGQSALPWIIGQIARVYGERKESAWNSVQEQQRQLVAKTKHAELVTTIDLPLDDFIHLGAVAFPRLAARFARVADRLVYRNLKEPPPPALRSISAVRKDPVSGAGWIDANFDHVVGGLRANGEPHGFSLLDVAGQPVPAIFKTTLHDSAVRVHLLPEFLTGGLRLVYGHGNAPICNVTDARDCALPVFGPGVRRPAQKLRSEIGNPE